LAAIETWEATRLEGVSKVGRTHPLVLRCRQPTTDGKPIQATKMVKVLGLPEVTQPMLICEVAGNAIAKRFGLLTADPCIVNVSLEAAVRINDNLARINSGLSIRSGTAAGCEFVRAGVASVSARLRLNSVQEQHARLIYCFDLMAQNPDRTTQNPNCGAVANGLLAFYFGECFSHLWLPIIGGIAGEAWEVTKHGLSNRHLFHATLQGGPVDAAYLKAAVFRLSDSWWNDLHESFPVEWRPGLVKIQEYLLSVRDHAAEFVEQIQWSLA
jgi:hypothetical protein